MTIRTYPATWPDLTRPTATCGRSQRTAIIVLVYLSRLI